MATTARGRTLLVFMIVFTVLITLSIIGRFWSCYLQRRRLRFDDGLVIFAFLNILALEIPSFMVYNHKLGAHVWQLTPDDISLFLKVEYSASITWTLATCSCKLAVLWMYKHIFPARPVKIAVYTFIGLEVSFMIAFLPIFLTICNPPSAFWSLNATEQAAKCHPIQRQQYASVITNMVLDLAVVILPLPEIWKLRLPTSKKVFITFMFGLGIIAVGVMAWRIYTTYESTKTADWSYLLVTTAIQSHLELWLGLLAANLPMMGHLIKSWAPAIQSTLVKFKGGSGYFSNDNWSMQRPSSSWKNSRKSKKTFEALTEDSAIVPFKNTAMSETTTRTQTGTRVADVELGSLPVQNKVNDKNVNRISIYRGFDFQVDSLSRDEHHHDPTSPIDQGQRRSPWS